MKNIATFLLTVMLPLLIITIVLRDAGRDNLILEDLREEYSIPHIPSVDHSKHAELQREFTNPHELTATCLSCHTERGEEVLANAHWNWEREAYIEGRGVTYLGKRNLINNFCTGILSNEATCNRCHIGYGWSDSSFDHSNPYNIDCLICHDNSGLYDKARGGAGYPVPGLDLSAIAQQVGLPRKDNCGYCHFYGGGGNNVKHGDLERALLTASWEVDVHMSMENTHLECVDCHKTTNHQMLGRYYGVSSENTQRATCESCHTSHPHINNKLNEHTIKVACQTCHIPVYAKVNPTKMHWDWSTATDRRDGEPYEILDTLGNLLYTSIKGDFHWRQNAVPDYVWFNGTADHHLISDLIGPNDTVIYINTLFGDARDPDSRIHPVKIHTGRQPYDTEYRTIIQAKLWDAQPGAGALWVDLDWDEAVQRGMDYVGMPVSGEYDFIESKMFLLVNHMVSPADQALSCEDCHTRSGGRLANIEGIYIPAQTTYAAIDYFGVLMLLFSFIGIVIHASIRYIVHRKNSKKATH